MNSIDFSRYSQFPLSAETLAFMQSMTALLGNLSALGGTNYILSGCTEIGNTVSNGVVVANGEILPFEGGTKTPNVVIRETKESVQVYNTAYSDLYTSRSVIFGTGAGQMPYSSFVRISSLADLTSSLATLTSQFNAHVNTPTFGRMIYSGKYNSDYGFDNEYGEVRLKTHSDSWFTYFNFTEKLPDNHYTVILNGKFPVCSFWYEEYGFATEGAETYGGDTALNINIFKF